MAGEGATRVVLDTSVLINFLAVGRLDLLSGFQQHDYILTGHVIGEILSKATRSRLMEAVAAARNLTMGNVLINSPAGELFAKLTGEHRLGAGECAAIAYASTNGCSLAIDDRAARKVTARYDSGLQIVGTEDLVVLYLAHGCLDVAQADGMKKQWEEHHRFRLPFASFSDKMPAREDGGTS